MEHPQGHFVHGAVLLLAVGGGDQEPWGDDNPGTDPGVNILENMCKTFSLQMSLFSENYHMLKSLKESDFDVVFFDANLVDARIALYLEKSTMHQGFYMPDAFKS